MGDSPSDSVAIDAIISRLGLELPGASPSVRRAVRTLITANQALSKRIDQLSIELEDARRLADHDPLCPVFNRRAFTRELSREIALAKRHATDLSILFLDLDQFKQVNDRLGHRAGDEVLKNVANALLNGVRKTDIVGRLGGDEFGIILIRAGQIEADARLARLAAQLEEDVTRLYGVSASIGLATWKIDQSVDDLMAAADRRMFDQKAAKPPE